MKLQLLLAEPCPALCNPMDCRPPGSSVHGTVQARILECVAVLFSRGSSRCKDQTWVSWIAGRFFIVWATREAPSHPKRSAVPVVSDSCDPVDGSLPGSSVHGILKTRILQWVAISFSRGSSRPRDRTWVSRIVGRRFTVWATSQIS